jgi:elongation factor G
MGPDAIQAIPNRSRPPSRGRGTFTMEFDNYAEVPANLVEKLMEKETK